MSSARDAREECQQKAQACFTAALGSESRRCTEDERGASCARTCARCAVRVRVRVRVACACVCAWHGVQIIVSREVVEETVARNLLRSALPPPTERYCRSHKLKTASRYCVASQVV